MKSMLARWPAVSPRTHALPVGPCCHPHCDDVPVITSRMWQGCKAPDITSRPTAPARNKERVLFMSLLFVRRLPSSRIHWLKLVLRQLKEEAWSYGHWLTQSSLPQPYRGWWLPGPWWVSASNDKEGKLAATTMSTPI